MCQPFPPIVNMAGRTLSLCVREMIIRIAKRQCHTINWTREVISITNITIFIVLREKKKRKKKRSRKMKKRVKEWGREKRDRWEREKTQKTQLRSVCLLYEKKKKKSKRKKKNYHVPRRKRDRFIPQDSTIEMRIASTCVFTFEISSPFFFFFFSFLSPTKRDCPE